MAVPATRPPGSLTSVSRSKAILDLRKTWQLVRETSTHVQQLDEPVVRHDEWGTTYELASSSLHLALGQLNGWELSPYPAEAYRLHHTRSWLGILLRAAVSYLERFEWHMVQAMLFDSGSEVVRAATIMGVDL